MDANGTRFHLLLGKSNWSTCRDGSDPRVTLAAHFGRVPSPCGGGDDGGFGWIKRTAELTLRPCVVVFEAARNDTPPDALGVDRRGAARDQYGNTYWIAESATEIRIIPAASGVATHFWSADDERQRPPHDGYGSFHAEESPRTASAVRFAGLAITDDHYLVAGVLDTPALLVFDLHAGGPPEKLIWPADAGGFVPFDLAQRPGGGVWVLDRANRRYWALNRQFTVETLDLPQQTIDPGRADPFQPLGPAPIRRTTPRLYPAGVPIDPASDPIAIEGMPDGTVVILDRGHGRGHARLLHDGVAKRFGAAAPLGPAGLDAYDVVFAAAAQDGSRGARLYTASVEGNQAYAYDLATEADGRLSATLATEYFPMRLFGGKGLIAAGAQPFYDFFDGWVPLVTQRRPRYAPSAALQTPVFDGREPACVWHRLMLDACIPPDTTVHVRTRASDERASLPSAPWLVEPDPYLRRDGSELPFSDSRDGEGRGTWELLFQRAQGRYLQIELTLTGNGRTTPRVRALRAYYPRFSYLQRYMPAVYRDDDASSSFLDRFLANVEGFLTTTEDRIAAAELLFSVRSAPADALDWLASWFGVALDPSWTEAKRRLFIEHAMDFFRRRGTTLGLQAAIRLAIDDCVDATLFTDNPAPRRGLDQVRIVETWRTRQIPPVVAGDPTRAVGPQQVRIGERWNPAQGRSHLNERYRAALAANGVAVSPADEFPVRKPSGGESARLWAAFAQDVLGFVPSATRADTPAWRAFLLRRYRDAKAIVRAYEAPLARLALPARLPDDGAPLADWHAFESAVLATRATAHRFSVLLPVPRGDNLETRRVERLDLVRRVVELEKPAHTVFDVKFYWALFRIGEARLGDDTLIDRGGRSPDLLPPLRLGQAYLAETVLEAGHPQNVNTRRIVGRDALAAPASQETSE